MHKLKGKSIIFIILMSPFVDGQLRISRRSISSFYIAKIRGSLIVFVRVCGIVSDDNVRDCRN